VELTRTPLLISSIDGGKFVNCGTMSQKYSQINTSATDLYAERDRLSWAYRTIALVASWFVLGAYILAPLIFTSTSGNLKPTRNTMVALAVAMLVVGYVGLIMAAFLSRSLLFCFESVALPALTSSVEGLFSVVMNHALHKVFPVSDTYIVVPLVLVCISVVAFGLWTAFLYRRISSIKRSGGGHPVPLTFQEPSTSPGMGYLSRGRRSPSPGMRSPSPGMRLPSPGRRYPSTGMGDSSSTQGLLPPHQQQYSRG
jgi:hypothetical protein